MHREAQWSMMCLHCEGGLGYEAARAALFVRHLEDHTGFRSEYGSAQEFEAVRALYEQPGLDWATLAFDPPLPAAPYVVMELARGEPLIRVRPEDLYSPVERCAIALQAAHGGGPASVFIARG